MVQLDVFLAYGMCSTLAVASRRRLEQERTPLESRYFALTLLWLATTFAPQAVWLMWAFPAWETMFVFRNHAELPAWLAAAVPASMILSGAAGFLLTARLLERGRAGLALGLTALSLLTPLVLATIGWDGTGYRRLLTPVAFGSLPANGDVSLSAFLTSDVAIALGWLLPLLLVPYGLMLWRWQKGAAS